jgi:hypothetical protein
MSFDVLRAARLASMTMSENRQFDRALGEKITAWSCPTKKSATELYKAGMPVLTV